MTKTRHFLYGAAVYLSCTALAAPQLAFANANGLYGRGYNHGNPTGPGHYNNALREKTPDAYYYSQAPHVNYYHSTGYGDPYAHRRVRAYDLYRRADLQSEYVYPAPYDATRHYGSYGLEDSSNYYRQYMRDQQSGVRNSGTYPDMRRGYAGGGYPNRPAYSAPSPDFQNYPQAGMPDAPPAGMQGAGGASQGGINWRKAAIWGGGAALLAGGIYLVMGDDDEDTPPATSNGNGGSSSSGGTSSSSGGSSGTSSGSTSSGSGGSSGTSSGSTSSSSGSSSGTSSGSTSSSSGGSSGTSSGSTSSSSGGSSGTSSGSTSSSSGGSSGTSSGSTSSSSGGSSGTSSGSTSSSSGGSSGTSSGSTSSSSGGSSGTSGGSTSSSSGGSSGTSSGSTSSSSGGSSGTSSGSTSSSSGGSSGTSSGSTSSSSGGSSSSSGGDAAGTHPADNSPDLFNSAESRENPAIAAFKAYDAYARGYSGRNYERDSNGNLVDNTVDDRVVVGVLDSIIDTSVDDLSSSDAILAEEAVTCDNVQRRGCEEGDALSNNAASSHGTVVSTILAGRKNGRGMHGLAYTSSIIPVHFLDLDVDGDGQGDGSDVHGLEYLIDEEVAVINASYGFEDDIRIDGVKTNKVAVPIIAGSRTEAGEVFSPADLANGFGFPYGGNLTYYDVFPKIAEGDTVVVYAGGNNPTDNLAVLAGLPYYFRGDMDGNADKPAGYDLVNPDKIDLSKKWVGVIGLERVPGSSDDAPLKDQWEIAPFSARCGVAKEWCIGAPADYTGVFPEGTNARGTSFAAPAVTGAVAVIRGAFPHLSAEQVTRVLFGTATDLGAAGVDDIYGHGLVNLDAATSPAKGNWTLATGALFTSAGQSFDASALAAGGAFGDALQDVRDKDVMILDEYGRNFTVSLGELSAAQQESGAAGYERAFSRFGETREVKTSSVNEYVSVALVNEPAPAVPLQGSDGKARDAAPAQAMLTEISSGASKHGSVGFRQFFNASPETALAGSDEGSHNTNVQQIRDNSFSQAFANGHLHMMHNTAGAAFVSEHNGARFSFGAFAGKAGERDAYTDASLRNENAGGAQGFAARYEKTKNGFGFSAQLGMVREDETMLNGRPGGAFSVEPGASTSFASAGMTYNVNKKLSFSAEYHIGVTNAKGARNSLVSDIDAVVSDAFSAAATYEGILNKNDRAAFTVSQPLRIRSGGMGYRLPDSVSADGAIRYTRQRAGLAPSAREINLEGYYQVQNAGEESALSVGGGVKLNAGHSEDSAPEGLMMLKYKKKF